MRFPFSLARSMTGYLVRKRLARQKRFPLVLMLEPLHACNLSCAGCGRVREYADWVDRRLSLAECLAAVDECGAPIVSLCGGEPLIYAEIAELVEAILARRKHIYLCTNGLALEAKLARFRPSTRLAFSVHLDGMEATHDAIVQRQGVFVRAVKGIQAAKRAGFLVYTNTTVYRQTDLDEVAVLFEYLRQLGVDGFMLSPAFGYEVFSRTEPDAAERIFMTRQEIREKFRRAERRLAQYPLASSPVYLDFLCGRRELSCAAWANPTYNVRGWKGPCYLITDAHYRTYRELLAATDWDGIGPGRDRRCEHCLVHCGFEPSAVLGSDRRPTDLVRMALWQMG